MSIAALLRTAFGKESRAVTAAFILLLAAIFVPSVNLPRETYTYLVFIDITQSMNVEDYDIDGAPVSRLDYARQAVRRALRALPCGSHVGLGAFAEYRTLLLVAPIEVCGNYNDLLASLDYLDGRMRWSNSSEIAKGVFWSVRGAKQVGEGTQVIFMTDGQEAPPLRVSARPSFDDVKPGQVHGWIIGVGGYTPQPIPKTDREGNPAGYWRAEDVIQSDSDPATGAASASREHLSALREPHLQALARQVGFDYAHLTRPSQIAEAMRDSRFAQRRPVPTDLYWLPATAALILLALRFRPDVRLTERLRLQTARIARSLERMARRREDEQPDRSI
jgi:mxaL protein